jgi:hypothetical protein
MKYNTTMFSPSSIFGLLSFLTKSLSIITYFPNMYASLRYKYNPDPHISPPVLSKETILCSLVFSISAISYSTITFPTPYLILSTYLFTFVIDIIYLNMLLFLEGNKKCLLIYTLVLVYISYIIMTYVHSSFIIILCLITTYVSMLLMIRHTKEVFIYAGTDEIDLKLIDFSELFLEVIITLGWIIYSLCDLLVTFFICNVVQLFIFSTMIVAFYYQKQILSADSSIVKITKLFYGIKTYKSIEEIENIKEKMLVQLDDKTNNINNN